MPNPPAFQPTRSSLVTFTLAAALTGCSKPGPKPSNADIAGYLAQVQPGTLQVRDVRPSFEALSELGSSKLPTGSWRVLVQFTLHAQQDLYAPTATGLEQRADFDRAVAQFEQFRVARIAGVEQLAHRADLMPPGAIAPEPAMPVSVVTHKNQDLADTVTLLAQPDGTGWKFVQLDAQTLSDAAIGAPLDDLRRQSPATHFVVADSAEEQMFRTRAARFLQVLAKAAAQPQYQATTPQHP